MEQGLGPDGGNALMQSLRQVLGLPPGSRDLDTVVALLHMLHNAEPSAVAQHDGQLRGIRLARAIVRHRPNLLQGQDDRDRLVAATARFVESVAGRRHRASPLQAFRLSQPVHGRSGAMTDALRAAARWLRPDKATSQGVKLLAELVPGYVAGQVPEHVVVQLTHVVAHAPLGNGQHLSHLVARLAPLLTRAQINYMDGQLLQAGR
jgi:hypothetical protein